MRLATGSWLCTALGSALWLASACAPEADDSELQSRVTADQDAGASIDAGGDCVTIDEAWQPGTTYSPVVDAQVPISYADTNSYCRTRVVRCTPTKGPLPPEASDATGRLIWERVPDYVAYGPDELIGYISRYDVFCGRDAPADVYDESLRRVIGQYVPGRGFRAKK